MYVLLFFVDPIKDILSGGPLTREPAKTVSGLRGQPQAQFKTMKYTPDYPNRFDSLGHARAWKEEFMAWYNHEHRHSRIGLHTPASVHYGTAHDIRAARQTILDAAWLAHPERFNRRPAAPRLPERVTINDPAKRIPNPQPQKA